MPVNAQSLRWVKRAEGGKGRALLLVHGVGNAKPGDYDGLLPPLRDALGPDYAGHAVYTLYYDALNDMMAEKTRLADVFGKLLGLLKAEFGSSNLGRQAAEVAGDVIWPVLSLAARQAIRSAYLLQLQQIVIDGIAADFPADRQSLSIICHSLGCFHTYEALHAAATDKSQKLTPTGDLVAFKNVIFMASPVKMIRTVAGALGVAAPGGLASLAGADLACSSTLDDSGRRVYSVERWISITGALDPVGGHLFRRLLKWAYMEVPADPPAFKGQVSRIDPQRWIQAADDEDLRQILWNALQARNAEGVAVTDPHSWKDYIVHNAGELKQWLDA